MTSALDVPGFHSIDPVHVTAYLRSHGWNVKESRHADVAVFRRATERGEVSVNVLTDKTYGDFLVRMAEVADAVRRVESRPIYEVVNDLLSPQADQLRFRVKSEGTAAGSLGLNASAELRAGLKNLILSAAHSAIAPSPHFSRLSQRPAMDLLNACRERQSERGSYVASISIPLTPPIGQLALEGELGRRTTRMLFSAFSIAAQSAVQPELLLHSSDKGLSANLLEALGQLEPEGRESAVELDVNWLGGVPEAGFDKTILLPQSIFGYFKTAAKELKETSPLNDTIVQGFVIALKRERSNEPGRATVFAHLESFGDQRVSVQLEGAHYEAATEAHKTGRRIQLRGVLRKSGRSFELVDHGGIQNSPSDDWDTAD